MKQLRRSPLARPACVAATVVLLASGQTPPVPQPATSVTVMTSGGFAAAFQALGSGYERASGSRIATVLGASMGSTPTAIPMRLDRNESADVVILAREALDKLADKGQVIPTSRTDLALSRIALAVRADAAAPDIGTDDALRKVLLRAKSVAYSDSASGVYVSGELYKRLGIAGDMAAKSRMIPGTPVGEIVARGEAEIGLQQFSELKPIKGIKIVGLIPEDLQKVTTFAAGVVARSSQPGRARELIAFLASSAAFGAIRDSGMEPAQAAAKK